MRRHGVFFIAASFAFALSAAPAAHAEALKDCAFNGIALHGKVKVVESYADLKVEVVESYPDLKVKAVESYPGQCGEWQFVDSYPDFEIQYVESYPDIKIEMVESYPGVP